VAEAERATLYRRPRNATELTSRARMRATDAEPSVVARSVAERHVHCRPDRRPAWRRRARVSSEPPVLEGQPLRNRRA
jgi:hypothetical protein